MKIAVPFKDDVVYQRLGYTEHMKVYKIEDEAVEDTKLLKVEGTGHEVLVDLLKDADVDVLICGRLGLPAEKAFNEAGIEVYGGVIGLADEAVKDFLAGELVFNPDAAYEQPYLGHHRYDGIRGRAICGEGLGLGGHRRIHHSIGGRGMGGRQYGGRGCGRMGGRRQGGRGFGGCGINERRRYRDGSCVVRGMR